MDTTAFIEKLNSIFCEINRNNKKYSCVWLTEVDFGGLYQNDKYVLNVKAEHQIDSCNAEIFTIIKLLDEKAKEELQNIWRVDVYNANEEIHCWSEELLVFDESDACNT